MDPREPKRTDFRRLAALSSLGLLLPSSIAVGLFFGYWLDNKLGTRPYMLLIFFALGVISGFLSLWRGIRKYGKDTEDDAGSP